MSKYMVPYQIGFRDALPKTSTGKIDKSALERIEKITMVISGLVLTGSAVAGYWSITKYNRTKKRSVLVEAIARPARLHNMPMRTTALVERGNALAQRLNPSHLLPPPVKQEAQALLKQLDNRYQLAIHNSIDHMFGQSYEKHLRALGGTTGVDAMPPLVKRRNREMGSAILALGLVLTGVPALVLASFAINIYISYVIIQIGIRDMQQKRRFTARGRQSLFYHRCPSWWFSRIQKCYGGGDHIL